MQSLHKIQHQQQSESSVVETLSAAGRKPPQTSRSRRRELLRIQGVETLVRNRKRRLRLLAKCGLLQLSMGKKPRRHQRKSHHRLPSVIHPSEGQADFGANECGEKRLCVGKNQDISSSCCGAQTSRKQPSSLAIAPSSAAASLPLNHRVHLPSLSSSPVSQDCIPSKLLDTVSPSIACSAGEVGSPASSVCRSGATIEAPVSSNTSCASSAFDPYRLLNPPSFAALGVPPALIRVAASLHVERPSPIQILTLPRALQGGDLCGVAPTGTGKTLCYCWPLLKRIACGYGHAFLGLVLLPARELAVQVLEQFRIYGASLGTRVGVLLGGRDLTEEGTMLLQQAPHILIATPGRLADYVQNNGDTIQQRLSVVEVLVLDEADMLLSDDFKQDLKCILACLPPSSAAVLDASSSSHNPKSPTHINSASSGTSQQGEDAQTSVLRHTAPHDTTETLCEGGDHESQAISPRLPSPSSMFGAKVHGTGCGIILPRIRRQTLLFSATVNPALLALQRQRFGDTLMPLYDATAAALRVCQHTGTSSSEPVGPGVQEASTQQQVLLPRLLHYYLFVPAAMRFAYLLYLLEHVPPFNRDRGIIFAGSVRQTQRLCTTLEVLKQQVTSLHSLMKQRTRIACLEKFRSEVARLLVCTDVAGRGLDLPRVEFVICLEVPSKPQVYVHRTGRTARAGRKGIALTFVDPPSIRALHRIEACIHKRLELLPSFSENEALKHLNHYSRVLQKAALFLNEIGFDEKAEQHEAYSKASKELRRRARDAKPLPV